MKKRKEKKINAWTYLWMAVYAFAGLGCEMIVVLLEQAVYGAGMESFTQGQTILHWIFTCIVWGAFLFALYHISVHRYGFDPMKKSGTVPKKRLGLVLLLTIAGILEMAISWGGFKPWMELRGKTVLMLVFQYIYYLFESGLFVAVLIFGQKFGEERWGVSKIPYGGIVLALTWGLVHFLTQGLTTGIETVIFSIVFGVIQLCVGRNAKLTYLFCACIFLL